MNNPLLFLMNGRGAKQNVESIETKARLNMLGKMVTKQDAVIVKDAVVGIIPGGAYGERMMAKELKRITTPTSKREKDTFFEDLKELPKQAGVDVIKRVKSVPAFLMGAVATPALSITELVTGQDEQDFGPLGKQKSIQKQRRDMKKQGAGEVVAVVMPAMQYAMAVGGVKKITDVGTKGVKAYQRRSPQNLDSLIEKSLNPNEVQALKLAKQGKTFEQISTAINPDAAIQALRVVEGSGGKIKLLIDKAFQKNTDVKVQMGIRTQLEEYFNKVKPSDPGYDMKNAFMSQLEYAKMR